MQGRPAAWTLTQAENGLSFVEGSIIYLGLIWFGVGGTHCAAAAPAAAAGRLAGRLSDDIEAASTTKDQRAAEWQAVLTQSLERKAAVLLGNGFEGDRLFMRLRRGGARPLHQADGAIPE